MILCSNLKWFIFEWAIYRSMENREKFWTRRIFAFSMRSARMKSGVWKTWWTFQRKESWTNKANSESFGKLLLPLSFNSFFERKNTLWIEKKGKIVTKPRRNFSKNSLDALRFCPLTPNWPLKVGVSCQRTSLPTTFPYVYFIIKNNRLNNQ